MPNYLYVDNSNVWIEGKYVSAVTQGLAPDIWTAHKNRICDQSWSIDFGRLFEFAGGRRSEVGRAVLYGSRPPPNDSVWQAAKNQGFEVKVHDRNVVNREKKVDTSIVTDMVADSYERMKPETDELTLVAGDSDYVPTVEQLKRRGFQVYVVFWAHAAKELRDSCSEFTPLDGFLDHLQRKQQ